MKAFTLAEVEICGVRSAAESRGSEGNACRNDSVATQLARVKQISRQAFTLAEVLITLAIIGVVAALTIPSVISNSQQQEFKTGLRKAVSVLNSAITMNIALDGESPYDNKDTFRYLIKHMSVLKTTTKVPWNSSYERWDGSIYNSVGNAAFYTADGMRFETDDSRAAGGEYDIAEGQLKLHESDMSACLISWTTSVDMGNCGGCGSMGLGANPNKTTRPPCAILVDVNGDRKPTPQKAASTFGECQKDKECSKTQKYRIPKPSEKRVTDIFTILITEDRAIPYGVTAQKAMYSAQK